MVEGTGRFGGADGAESLEVRCVRSFAFHMHDVPEAGRPFEIECLCTCFRAEGVFKLVLLFKKITKSVV